MADRPPGYDLFLDESGTFMETSSSPHERRSADRQRRKFPSQLAGLIAPRGSLTKQSAADAMMRTFARIGEQAPESLHGVNLKAGQQFDALVRSLVEECATRGWQPIRLTNREQVSFGDRVANYTNLVAELALRTCQRKSREHDGPVDLFMTCAVVKLGEHGDDLPILLERTEYLDRLRETFGRAAVHRGLAEESSSWRIANLRTGSARTWPELMLCDLVSNASHDDFYKLGDDATTALAGALGEFDFTLRFRELVERVDRLIEDDQLGAALVRLAERATEPDKGGSLRAFIDDAVQRTLGELADLGRPARDPQLSIVLAHLEQLIVHSRSLVEGGDQARWVNETVVPRLRLALARTRSGWTLDWFEYALYHLGVSACNVAGFAGMADGFITEMDRLGSTLARQYEHTTLLLRGRVAQAVHQTCLLDTDAALATAEPVTQFFEEVGSMFGASMPDVFPRKVHSTVRGQALMACTLAHAVAALREPGHWDDVRRFSDLAIREFEAVQPRAQQMMLRCWIESMADNRDDASRWLADALDTEPTNTAIGDAIAALPADSVMRGNAILQWLVLGLAYHDARETEPAEAFRAAWRDSKLEQDPWCQRRQGPYPLHGIQRRLGRLHARADDRDAALGALSRMQDMVRTDVTTLTLRPLTLAAAQLEVAALLWDGHEAHARKLVDRADRAQPGALQLLATVGQRSEGHPQIIALCEDWRALGDRLLSGGISARDLCAVTRVLPF